MLGQKSLVVIFAFCFVMTSQGAAIFAPLLPVDSLLLTTTAATLLDTTIINRSGTYYLYVDLDGPLVINAPQVVLNLSGNTINGGVTLTESASTVAIYNGLINGAGAVGVTVLEGVKNILLSQILLRDCSTGILAGGSLASPITKISLEQIEVQGATIDGANLSYCQELFIADSTFYSNGNYGLYVQNCNRGLVESCSFINNITTGMVVDAASNIKLIANSSSSNGNYGYFFSSAAQAIAAYNCDASNNTLSGFLTQGSVSMIECETNNNGGDGFTIQTIQTSLLQSCRATNNVLCGFNDLASVNVSYISNIAHANGNDYCVLGAPVVSGLAPYYYASIAAGAAGVSSWTNVQA